MNPSLWSKWVWRLVSRPETPRRHPAPRGTRPVLEVLEDRTVPAIFNIGAGQSLVLIEDILTANKNGESNVINLAPGSSYDLGFVNNFWYGPNGLPAITSDLTIHGNGATIERDPAAGTPDFRLFYVSGGLELPAGTLTMDNVTLANGLAKGGDSNQGGGGLGAGGAIFNQGTLNLTDVTLTNNEALGGSSGVATAGNGGGGIGQNAPSGTGDGGGFGDETGLGGHGGAGGAGGGGGGGGFLAGANGQPGPATDTGTGGKGGGLGGFGGAGDKQDGGQGGGNQTGGAGGNFDDGGHNGGGGGGVGGGGGFGLAGNNGDASIGGSGGFGGGGGAGTHTGGFGGFGGGGGASLGDPNNVGFPGFGGGVASTTSGGGGAGMGGAIFNMGADSARSDSGKATLVNCTLAGNTAQGGSSPSPGPSAGSGLGGAVFNLDGSVTLTNDTVDANHATDGGAVYNAAFGNDIDTGSSVTASLVLNNSILADSVLPPGRGFPNVDLVSTFINGSPDTSTVSGSHNLVMSSNGPIGSGVIMLTASPKLGPLQNNGGLTPTMLPQSGSPVLGAGDANLAPPTDQRGQPRTTKAPTDLGSVEVSIAQSPPSSPPGSLPNSPPPSSPPPPPPSLLQALITLYIDGIEMEAFSQATLASIRSTPQSFDTATKLGHLLQFFGSPSPSVIEASIAFNEPFAGPFGPLVVMAGEHAVDQALQQMSAS